MENNNKKVQIMVGVSVDAYSVTERANQSAANRCRLDGGTTDYLRVPMRTRLSSVGSASSRYCEYQRFEKLKNFLKIWFSN